MNEAIIEFRYNLPPDEELMAKLVGFRTKLFSLLTLRVGQSNDKKNWNEIKNLHNILLQIKTVAALKKLVKMTKLSLETTHKFEIQNDDVRPLIEWLDALKRKTEPDSLLRKIVENFHDKVISVSRQPNDKTIKELNAFLCKSGKKLLQIKGELIAKQETNEY